MNSPQVRGAGGWRDKMRSERFIRASTMHSKASQDGCPTWIDAAGRLHSPAGADARIVSWCPPLTELVFDLGPASAWSGAPASAYTRAIALRAVPKVGGTKDVNLARIRELAPTHVLVNMDENRRETVDAPPPSCPTSSSPIPTRRRTTWSSSRCSAASSA